MKIAIFGGSFDPVHTGHTQGALCVMRQFSLDRVIFVPLKNPVHKRQCSASEADRLQMLKIALAKFSCFELSEIETQSEEASYTVTTIIHMRNLYPNDDLFLIMGSDSYNTLRSWKQPEKIAAECRMIILNRPGHPVDYSIEDLSGKILVAKNSLIDISSSEIRNGTGTLFLDKDVYEYILKKELYKH